MELESAGTADQMTAQRGAASARGGMLAGIAIVACAAVLIAGYLTWISLREAAAPVGCGPGSGCERVLASAWSRWFNLPVGAPAAAVYLAIAVAALLARQSASPGQRRGAWAALLIFSTMAAGAAVWFVILQSAVLRAFCPWCLALHACGVTVLALVWTARPRQSRIPGVAPALASAPAVASSPADASETVDASGAADPSPRIQAAPRPAGLVLVGLLGVGVLVVGQWLSSPAKKQIQITALPGVVSVSPSDHPVLGSPDARHVVFVLADYTCPHCRRLRQQLDAAMARYGPEQLALAILPVPLNADCNDAVQFTEDRQKPACELARAALAVWAADPAKFAEMDRWLVASQDPPTPEAARAHAAALVGAAAFERAAAGPRVESRLQGNVDLYKAAGKGRLPKMLFPDRVTEGEAEDTAALFALLEKHLSLTAPATGPTSP